jgi:hypothetical protein|tara:strand:+ start:98 stop:619 length:522 start_codon:yes stop_codon:yes gene_type:complete
MATIAPSLREHGIQTEDSDIRCHVAPGTRNVFVFRTAAALHVMGDGPERTASQPGVSGVTGRGRVVPWDAIPGMRRIRWYSVEWWTWFARDQSTSEKGAHAVQVVQHLLGAGRFPLWCGDVDESKDATIQIAGTDIVVAGRWRIQVKCDYDAGPGGTGNLFLQTAECNPLGRI